MYKRVRLLLISESSPFNLPIRIFKLDPFNCSAGSEMTPFICMYIYSFFSNFVGVGFLPNLIKCSPFSRWVDLQRVFHFTLHSPPHIYCHSRNMTEEDKEAPTSSVVDLATPTRSIKANPTFEANSQHFFLTYSQCTAPKEDLLQFLTNLKPTQYVLVCSEMHKNGDPHSHALVSFVDSFHCHHGNVFDYICGDRVFHPHIQPARNTVHVRKYIKKDGNFIERGEFVNAVMKRVKRVKKETTTPPLSKTDINATETLTQLAAELIESATPEQIYTMLEERNRQINALLNSKMALQSCLESVNGDLEEERRKILEIESAINREVRLCDRCRIPSLKILMD